MSSMTKMINKNRLTILLASGALAVYIVILLVLSFYSYSSRNQFALNQLKIDAEKLAEALSYFFSERKDDIKTLVGTSTLANYFTNQDLGMSMEYGLKASLNAITNLLLDTVTNKKIKNDDIYDWIILFNPQGTVLAGTLDNSLLLPILNETKPWLNPDMVTPTILTETRDGKLIILISMAFFHKNRYRGQLLAEVNFPAAILHFIDTSSGTSAKKVCIVANGVCIQQGPINKDSDLANIGPELFNATLDRVQIIKLPNAAGQLTETILVNTPIFGTPYFLFTLIPTREVFGAFSPMQLTVAMTLLALLILYGVLVGLRINTENLILHARFEESRNQQKTLASRNLQLQQEILKRQEGEYLLNYLAHHDPLTDLPNQLSLQKHLKQAMQEADTHAQMVAVMFIDLDRFKNVNDTLGHPVGDQLLRNTAARLTSILRHGDMIARLGGDEFIVVLNQIGTVQDAELVAQKILDVLSKPNTIQGRELFLTASIGISLYPSHGKDATEMIMNADAAMYQAKSLGRNGFQFYTMELTEAATQRFSLENNLRRALERGELILYYQPQFSCRTGQIASVEALVRWAHPDLGFILPDRFIPLAEESGLIEPIGEWVLWEACRQFLRWQSLAFPPPKMAINLSSRQIMNPGLTPMVISCLQDTGVAPSSLELEVTEGSLMYDPQRASTTLRELHGLGVNIVLDDFGTGYSSMSYLKRFRLNKLKIDRSFIQDIPHSQPDVAIIKAIIALGRGISITVTSEGVESREQLAYLKAWGCDEWQGFLFSKPVAAASLEDLFNGVHASTTASNHVGNVIDCQRQHLASVAVPT